MLSSGGSAIELVACDELAGGFRQFLSDTERVGARLHLFPNVDGLNADVKPQHDQVVEQVGAFAHDAVLVAFDSLDGDLARLFDQFAGKLAPAGLQ